MNATDERALTADDVTEAPPMRQAHGGTHLLTDAGSVALSERGIAISVPVGTVLFAMPDGRYRTFGGSSIRYR